MTVSVLADFATRNAENVVVHTVLYSCCFFALASKMASWQNPTNIHASCMPFPGLVLYILFLSCQHKRRRLAMHFGIVLESANLQKKWKRQFPTYYSECMLSNHKSTKFEGM